MTRTTATADSDNPLLSPDHCHDSMRSGPSTCARRWSRR
jgi:hypothetical protein